ncbi:helix-turn-helix domain-containing protein [Chitinophaga pendula]|uniref:helix-turn-helix transcriptional regulator n=1 Tax=Chitinophaga TaxID=79328 RepID=UPI000BAFDB47|nr:MULTISPECIES: helix-turn-helix domain-containing protein [Chitinophaga]ASZ14727.1 transcriptional regulator [Chitinophaga sp. MD30]UCJ07612.1 helix-turn-helix domain-containing protein [Chitinophaga pendula]
MTEINNIPRYARSDLGYLSMIGSFISQKRKERKRTQEELAKSANVNRSTIQNIERGKSVNLLSLIQVLRVLEQLHVFDSFLEERAISPLKLAELEHKEVKRVRASAKMSVPKKNNRKSNW